MRRPRRAPDGAQPDCLTGYAWLQLPDRICEVHCGLLEFWYDLPGCALTDEELALLRRVATAGEPVLFQADDGSVGTHRAFDRRVDTLRALRQAGWIVRETWAAGPGQRGMRAGATRPLKHLSRSPAEMAWRLIGSL